MEIKRKRLTVTARDGQSSLMSQRQFWFGKSNFRGVVAAIVGGGRRSTEWVAITRWPATSAAVEKLLRRRRLERMGMGRRVSVRLLVLGLLMVTKMMMMMMMLLEVVVVVTAALRWLRRLRLLRPPATLLLLLLLNGMTGRCLMIARSRWCKFIDVLALFRPTQIRVESSDGPVEFVDGLAPRRHLKTLWKKNTKKVRNHLFVCYQINKKKKRKDTEYIYGCYNNNNNNNNKTAIVSGTWWRAPQSGYILRRIEGNRNDVERGGGGGSFTSRRLLCLDVFIFMEGLERQS